VRICKVGKPATTQAHLSFATILVISELHNHRVQEFKVLFPDIESFEQVRLTAKPVSKTCTAMSAHTHTDSDTFHRQAHIHLQRNRRAAGSQLLRNPILSIS
jgi:hypothetical protein